MSGLSGNRLDRLYAPPEIGAPGKRRAHAQRRDLLLAGGFVLSMAIIAVATLALMMPGLFGRAYRLDAYFQDAEGLDTGMRVLQTGYAIGLVERVTPIFADATEATEATAHCLSRPEQAGPDSTPLPCFRATLRIAQGWPIPRDSLAQIGAEGLLKGDAIKITPGAAPTQLTDGEVIGVAGRELNLMAQVGGLTETLKGLIETSIAPTIERIHDQIKSIEALIGSGDELDGNREQLAGVFENLQALSARLRDAVDPQSVVAILTSVQTLSEDLAGMTSQLRGSIPDVQRAVTNYGDLAVDARALVAANKPALQKSLDETQYLLQELSAALVPILSNIEDATRNLSALSRDLRNDPKTLLRKRDVEEQTPWFK